MDSIAGYHSINKPGKPSEDRYKILGGAHVMPDNRFTPFTEKNRGLLCGVFDGAGGAPLGMKASTLASDNLISFFTNENIPNSKQGIEQILLSTNKTVNSWGLMEETDRPLGATTATVAWLNPEKEEVVIFHVGDTMAYKLNNDGLLSVLTTEHGYGRGISRYIGQNNIDFKLDVITISFKPDDVLCIVSDGVTKGVNNHELQSIINNYLGEPALAAKAMVEKAQRKGVIDDISSIVIELENW